MPNEEQKRTVDEAARITKQIVGLAQSLARSMAAMSDFEFLDYEVVSYPDPPDPRAQMLTPEGWKPRLDPAAPYSIVHSYRAPVKPPADNLAAANHQDFTKLAELYERLCRANHSGSRSAPREAEALEEQITDLISRHEHNNRYTFQPKRI